MCEFFEKWKDEIESYCKANSLNFEKVRKAAKSYSKDDIAFLHIDEEKGKMGLLDETPAAVMLWVKKGENGELIFEQTEHTRKYLGKE